jgi:hypothetical protein
MFCLVEGNKPICELYNREPGASECSEAFFRAQLGGWASSPLSTKQEQHPPRKSTFNVKHIPRHQSLLLSDCANFTARIRYQPLKVMARHENTPDAPWCNLACARLAQGPS